MEIILHLGAHRTASTSFQRYMQINAGALTARGIGYWGPDVTRDGLLSGVIPVNRWRTATTQLNRARGRIALRVHGAKAEGLNRLIVSDENMIGSPRGNLRDGRLYAAIGERMARFAYAFEDGIGRVFLSVRSQDTFWASALAYSVARGHRIPRPEDLDRLVTVNRNWREVLTDLACALPGVEILVMPHEIFAGLPEERLRLMTGLKSPPTKAARDWLNRSPDLDTLHRAVTARGGDGTRLPEGQGRWQPFDCYQRQALQEAYADDLSWLRAGADGLARLTEETGPVMAEGHPPIGETTRGHRNGIEERRLA
ncbi:MAG: hypothetical protein COW54_07465 [Rhodobacteraceae bacterium CG17_big_fil_post_rev_8_21_14_2_50_63_15]|nr:hypothetical protein [Roseovarius sp.]PIV78833.1 MAG: hypothetical protein COW54_07465 [Rhodobacteraceae bacterium CG17_big_fil_post_rev_8_21_14_2_50_63_15]